MYTLLTIIIIIINIIIYQLLLPRIFIIANKETMLIWHFTIR
jgi:hypothetical protein